MFCVRTRASRQITYDRLEGIFGLLFGTALGRLLALASTGGAFNAGLA